MPIPLDNACLQTIRQCFIQNLSNVIVQPFGTQVQHRLADRQEGGQLQQGCIDFLEAGKQFLHNRICQCAPLRLLPSIGVHQHLDCAARGQESDMGQQRMLLPQIIEYGINHRFGHHNIQICQCLLGVCGTHCLAQLLVILLFLRGQLTHTTGGQRPAVILLSELFDFVLIVLLDVLTDARHHVIHGGGKALLVILLQRCLHCLSDFFSCFCIIVFHFLSLLYFSASKKPFSIAMRLFGSSFCFGSAFGSRSPSPVHGSVS